MENDLTNKLFKIFYKTCVVFTFLVLSFTIIMYTSANENTVKLFATTAPMILSILLFSFIYSLSSLYNEYGKINNTAKRILHFSINFINLWVCFFLIPGRIKQVTQFVVTAFFFMIVYLIIILIMHLVKKAVDKYNNI